MVQLSLEHVQQHKGSRIHAALRIWGIVEDRLVLSLLPRISVLEEGFECRHHHPFDPKLQVWTATDSTGAQHQRCTHVLPRQLLLSPVVMQECRASPP